MLADPRYVYRDTVNETAVSSRPTPRGVAATYDGLAGDNSCGLTDKSAAREDLEQSDVFVRPTDRHIGS